MPCKGCNDLKDVDAKRRCDDDNVHVMCDNTSVGINTQPKAFTHTLATNNVVYSISPSINATMVKVIMFSFC